MTAATASVHSLDQLPRDLPVMIDVREKAEEQTNTELDQTGPDH